MKIKEFLKAPPMPESRNITKWYGIITDNDIYLPTNDCTVADEAEIYCLELVE